MVPKPGYSYIIQDEFFDLFGTTQTSKICRNKGPGHGRPYYCCRKDPGSELYWMVPLSTKYEKYKKQYEKHVQLFQHCITIVLTKLAGKRAAILIQNAIPVHPDFIVDVYKQHGNPVPMHTKVQRIVYSNLQQSLAIHRRGGKVFFPDVDFVKELQESLFARGYDTKVPFDKQVLVAQMRAFRATEQTSREKGKSIPRS